MTVEGQRHTKRADAGQHLLDLLRREAANQLGHRQRTVHAGELGGFPLVATISQALGQVTITPAFDGAPGTEFALTMSDLTESDPAGLITRLENRLARLEVTKARTLADIHHACNEMRHAAESIGKPFPQTEELADARQHAREIDEQLEAAAAAATQTSGPIAETAIGTQHEDEASSTATRPRRKAGPGTLTCEPRPKASAPSPPWRSPAERQLGPTPTGLSRRNASGVPTAPQERRASQTHHRDGKSQHHGRAVAEPAAEEREAGQ